MLRKIAVWLFVKSISPRVKVKYTPNSFEFDFIRNSLSYCDDLQDFGFMRHLKEQHSPSISLKDFTYSILHELGHYFTADDLDDELKDDLETRVALSMVDTDTAKKDKELQDLYYNLPLEFAATEWAIEYANKHKVKCKLFDRVVNCPNHLLP